MFKFGMLFIVFSISFNVSAGMICTGCNTAVNTSINNSISSNNNVVGSVLSSNSVYLPQVKLKFGMRGAKGYWGTFYDQSVPPAETWTTSSYFKKIDDYISISLAINYPNCGRTFYVPFNIALLDDKTCRPISTPSGSTGTMSPQTATTRIRIDKKIINGSYTKNFFLADLGICEPYNCRFKEAIFGKVYVNLNIKVPQSCVINAGQIVVIDFDDIPVSSFKLAGEPADGVNPKTKNISISCDNIDAMADLTLRIQANKVSGNNLVSSNFNVGFRVNDINGNVIVPNDLNSKIPFKLNNGIASIPFSVLPVSITGRRPAAGKATSEGYLRVDFP